MKTYIPKKGEKGKFKRKMEKLLVTYDLSKLNQENIKTKTDSKEQTFLGLGFY